MISPTIGRIVWYHPSKRERAERGDPGDQPLAAIVAYVHSDTRVNLTVSDVNGITYGLTSVQLVQGDEEHEAMWCEWMPYQKGQAAKTEALEKAAAT